jgi:hypothetical protein
MHHKARHHDCFDGEYIYFVGYYKGSLLQQLKMFIFAAKCFGPCWPSSGKIHNYFLELISPTTDGSVSIAYSSPLNIFIHVIPEDGPYGPKHVVKIIRA